MKEKEIILSHHVNVNYGDPFIHFLNQFLPVQSLSGAGARHCCCRPSNRVHYGRCQSTAALTQRERERETQPFMATANLQSPNIHVIHLSKEAEGHADTGRACTHESQSSGCHRPSRHLRSHHEEAFRVERLHFLCTETLFSLTSFFDLMIFPLHCRQRLIY